MTLEEKAIEYGKCPEKVKARLYRAVCLLRQPYNIINNWFYDMPSRRLIYKDKKTILQWQIRQYPDKPESPENQQASVGIVVVKVIVDHGAI